MKKSSLLNTVYFSIIFFISPISNAALSQSAILNFNSPSFWGFDFDDNDSFSSAEITQILSLNGIAIETTQEASGNHLNIIDGSENPNIDQPWVFAGNTGMHQTTSNPHIISDDNLGNVLLDFSGWSMAYATNNDIHLATGSWGINPEGSAILTCSNDCSFGDVFTLFYTATVPSGDPSSFGDIKYCLGLSNSGASVDAECIGITGTIGDSTVVPVPAAIWLFSSGFIFLSGIARYKK